MFRSHRAPSGTRSSPRSAARPRRHPRFRIADGLLGGFVALWILCPMTGTAFPASQKETREAKATSTGQITGHLKPPSSPVTEILARPSLFGRWELAQLLEFEPGTIIDEETLRLTAENLLATDRVLGVDVAWETVPGGMRLLLELKPQPYVKKIGITGNHGVSKAKVRSWLTLRYYEKLDPKVLNKAVTALADRYEQNGFRRPSVRISAHPIGQDGAHELKIRITEDPLPKLEGGLAFKGLPDSLGWQERLWLNWRLYRGHLFGAPRLNKAHWNRHIGKAVRYLKKIGYPDATGAWKAEEKPSAPGKKQLILEIDAGRRTLVVASGEKPVKKLRGLFRKEKFGLSARELDRFLRKSYKLLKKQGLAGGQVSAKIEDGAPARTLRIRLDGGRQTTVREIRFSGNDSIPTWELLGAMLTRRKGWIPFVKRPFRQSVLNDDLEAVKTLYALRGFPAAKIEPEVIIDEKGDVQILLRIEEGRHHRVGEIKFKGQKMLSEQDLRELAEETGLVPGTDLSREIIGLAARTISLDYFKKGHPNATIQIRSDNRKGEEMDLLFTIDEKREQRAGKLIAKGNYKTSTALMFKRFGWEPEALLDSAKVAKLRKYLTDVGIFDSVLVETVHGADGRTDVVARVRERRSGRLDLSLIYDTTDSFGGEGLLSHENLFGHALKAEARARAQLNYYELGAALRKSTFFGYRIPVSLDATLSRDSSNPSFDQRRLGIELSAAKILAHHLRTTIRAKFEEISIDASQQSDDLPEPGRIVSISPALIWDRRDQLVDPRKGGVASIQFSLATDILGGQEEFWKLDLESRHYFALGERWTLAVAARGGIARPTGTTSALPLSERYFLGGSATHRAFSHDRLGPRDKNGILVGGDSFLLLNGELRFPLWGDLYCGLFVDAGNAFGFGESFSLRPGLGIGLRYMTIVGPVRFDVGWNPMRRSLVQDPTGQTGDALEDRLTFHIALGHAF